MANTTMQDINTTLATDIVPRAKGLATLQRQIVCSGIFIPSLAQTVYDTAVLGDQGGYSDEKGKVHHYGFCDRNYLLDFCLTNSLFPVQRTPA